MPLRPSPILLPPSGMSTPTLVAPPFANPGVETLTSFTQGLYQEFGGVIYLSSPSALVLVSDAFPGLGCPE